MEAELQARVNRPVELINREGLYVVIAALVIAILGCACVLGYSFANYGQLKKNAEEVRSYIASQTKVTDQKQSARREGSARKSSATSATAKAAKATIAGQNVDSRTANRNGIVAGLSERFAVLARQESLGDGERAETTHSILVASTAENGSRDRFAEAA